VPETSFTITFDGAELPVQAGQTIAAALTAGGHDAWRTTRVAGRPRGLFCGIGVCFDCLVTVNGTRSVRACLAAAEPGDIVTIERGVERDDLTI
jgi:aerobic-type carbon monoxide dehydrogenase small subunit (CoxS/CutS family)